MMPSIIAFASFYAMGRFVRWQGLETSVRTAVAMLTAPTHFKRGSFNQLRLFLSLRTVVTASSLAEATTTAFV